MSRPRRKSNPSAAPAALADHLLALQKTLFLRVQAIATSLVQGTHPSGVAGRGMEADGVRLYNPGDELRRIDWRVTARKGGLHVREFSAEKNLPTAVVLHRSPTLLAGRGRVKATRALEVCALLSAVGVAQGDRVALVVSPAFPESIQGFRSGRTQLELILRRLLEEDWTRPDPSPGGTLNRVAALLEQRSRVYLVSDFQVDKAGFADLRQGLIELGGRHAVIPVHITDRLEGCLPEGVPCRWNDPVTGLERHGGGVKAAEELVEALASQRRKIQNLFVGLGLEAWPIDVDEDMASRFQFFLSRRARGYPRTRPGSPSLRRASHG
jgi:uncharacterized protein (DUF58 family)